MGLRGGAFVEFGFLPFADKVCRLHDGYLQSKALARKFPGYFMT